MSRQSMCQDPASSVGDGLYSVPAYPVSHVVPLAGLTLDIDGDNRGHGALVLKAGQK